jgi:hypothetical protein
MPEKLKHGRALSGAYGCSVQKAAQNPRRFGFEGYLTLDLTRECFAQQPRLRHLLLARHEHLPARA